MNFAKLRSALNRKALVDRFHELLGKGSEDRGRYIQFGGLVFFTTALLSFVVFRDWEFRISVHLAQVQFKEVFDLGFDSKGLLKPLSSQDVTVSLPGKVDRYLAATGDTVKKGQVVAVTNEEVNRASLTGALQNFKDQTALMAQIKRRYRSGQGDQTQYQEAEGRFNKSKSELQVISKRVEESLIRAPADGIFRRGEKPMGELLPAGSPIATVEDLSKLNVRIQVPASKAKDIPSEAKVRVSLPNEPAIEVLADVHYASAKTEASPKEEALQIIFSAASIPPSWIGQEVGLSFTMRPMKNVALIDKKAIVKDEKESKIAVLSPLGTLHWQNVSGAPVVGEQLVLKGTNPKYFQVVLPTKIDQLKRAIASNKKAKVSG